MTANKLPNFSKSWLTQWKQAESNLSKIQKSELLHQTTEDRRKSIQYLLELADNLALDPSRKLDSGLIAQQALFKRALQIE